MMKSCITYGCSVLEDCPHSENRGNDRAPRPEYRAAECTATASLDVAGKEANLGGVLQHAGLSVPQCVCVCVRARARARERTCVSECVSE